MKDKALCPHCGDEYALQDIAPGDQIQERRLEPHADLGAVEAGYKPISGTCEGSNLIESKTGREERIRVLQARQHAAPQVFTAQLSIRVGSTLPN